MLMALCVIYCSLVRNKKTPVAIPKAAMAPTNAIKAAINIFRKDDSVFSLNFHSFYF